MRLKNLSQENNANSSETVFNDSKYNNQLSV